MVHLVIGIIAGCCAGWVLHARWLSSRITINPARRRWPDGEITEWLVNVGQPIVGRFPTKEEAKRHVERLNNALSGRATTGRNNNHVHDPRRVE